jgi:protocadherin delta 1
MCRLEQLSLVLRRPTPTSAKNARIRYDFSVETMRDFGDIFGVEPDTGELYTRASLDYETRQDYALYVTASDCGGNDVANGDWTKSAGESLSNQALVMVRLNDVNDNAPRIRVHALATSTVTSQQVGGPGDTGEFRRGGGSLPYRKTVPLGNLRRSRDR